MRYFICVVAGLVLAGGGGGGGGGGANFAGAQPLQPGQAIPNGAFSADGTAVQAEFGADGTTGTFSGPAAATLVASSDTNGNGPDAVRFSTRGETVEIDFTQAAQTRAVDGRVVIADNVDRAQITTTEDNLEFTVFGGWGRTTGPGGNPAPGDKINFGAFGAPTPEASMPSGSATYTGKSVGFVSVVGGDAIVTASDVTITTPDFDSIRIRSANTVGEIVAGDGIGRVLEVRGLDFIANGTVAGSLFNGTGAIGGVGAASVRVDGAFYGDAAQEASGTFSGLVEGGHYGGAFGARR